MRFPAPHALLAGVLFAFSLGAAAQVSLRDDLGRPVQVKRAATRIVTLAPFLTELVFAAGAGDKLVGVASMSDYPPEAKKLPEVTTGTQFSLEQMAGLAPDLVLAWRDGIRSEALEICHAENVFKDSPGIAPLVTWDEVYERNPYVIVSAGSAGSLEEFRSNWTVRQGLEAVKADRLVRPHATAQPARPQPRRSQYGE